MRVKKKTPTKHPHSVGGGILKKEVCETKQITITRGLYCKPDAKKKVPPPTLCRWGQPVKEDRYE
jgi:hypothetical protein